MINAEKFLNTFGFYATELWVMDEKQFLEWLNAEADICNETCNKSVGTCNKPVQNLHELNGGE